jgi:hypothetical protein
MERKNILRMVFYFVLVGALFGIFLFPALGQTPIETSAAPSTTAPGQLEALAAPIALFPDQLHAKVRPSSTMAIISAS